MFGHFWKNERGKRRHANNDPRAETRYSRKNNGRCDRAVIKQMLFLPLTVSAFCDLVWNMGLLNCNFECFFFTTNLFIDVTSNIACREVVLNKDRRKNPKCKLQVLGSWLN